MKRRLLGDDYQRARTGLAASQSPSLSHSLPSPPPPNRPPCLTPSRRPLLLSLVLLEQYNQLAEGGDARALLEESGWINMTVPYKVWRTCLSR